MKIVNGYRDLAADLRGTSAAIGNFDGVHRGHQALVADARKAGGPVGVISFEPHPRSFFQADAPPFRLTTSSENCLLYTSPSPRDRG